MKLTENVSTTVTPSPEADVSCNGYDWAITVSEYMDGGHRQFTLKLNEQSYRKLAQRMMDRVVKADAERDDASDN